MENITYQRQVGHNLRLLLVQLHVLLNGPRAPDTALPLRQSSLLLHRLELCRQRDDLFTNSRNPIRMRLWPFDVCRSLRANPERGDI